MSRWVETSSGAPYPRPGIPAPGWYPFWFWNGLQDEGGVARQLRRMRTEGCRGAAIHARTGNRIPYLSERWLELTEHACGVAESLGLKIWLYDEDGFPSGNAGRRVQASRPDLRISHLAFSYAGTDPARPAFAAFDTERFAPVDEAAVAAGTPALRFELCISDRHVDVLHPDTARLFLSLTHDAYAARLERYFGSVIEAVYTDDVAARLHFARGFAWSPALEEEFRKRHGTPLRESLPALAENLPSSPAVRRAYFDTLQALFIRNFIRPQIEWCHARGLSYFGHLCGDEGPMAKSLPQFGAAMPFMRTEDIPSLDDFLLDRRDQRYLLDAETDETMRAVPMRVRLAPLIPYKHAASAAHQFSRNAVSAELLAYLHWSVAPGFIARQMLFALGMGVNRMTPHAYYYTVGGEAKRDCPPSYSHQQPYSTLFGEWVGEWTRLAERLAQGRFAADTLLVVPDAFAEALDGRDVDSAFPMRTPRSGALAKEERRFGAVVLELMRRHAGFDLGDESAMAEAARSEGDGLAVGNMVYRTLLLLDGPPLRPETERVVRAFGASGGRVLSVSGDRPPETLFPVLELTGEGTEEILLHAMARSSGTEYFLVNLSGRDLRPWWRTGSEYWVYESDLARRVFCGGETPEGFCLRAGEACLLSGDDGLGKPVPLAESRFFDPGGVAVWEAVAPVEVAPLSDNVWAFKDTDEMVFTAPEGSAVRAAYRDGWSLAAPSLNGRALPVEGLSHHACDPCYAGVELAGRLRAGENRIRFSDAAEIGYLAGDFRIVRDGEGWRFAELPVGLGDLTRQGYPFYWGGFSYVFHFSGARRYLKLTWRGAVEVWLNGGRLGAFASSPLWLPTGTACRGGGNVLRVVLYNTAGNFINANPDEAFGLYGVEVGR